MSAFSFKFDHCVLYREIRGVFRPLLNVEFRLGESSVFSPMLLDSGADNIVLPAETMFLMSLSPEECKPVSANSFYGPSTGFWSPPVQVSLPDLDESFGFEAPVVFSPRLDGFGYGLLGREPTLTHFRVAFTHEIGPAFFLGL